MSAPVDRSDQMTYVPWIGPNVEMLFGASASCRATAARIEVMSEPSTSGLRVRSWKIDPVRQDHDFIEFCRALASREREVCHRCAKSPATHDDENGRN